LGVEFELISSTVAFSGKIFDIKVDQLRLPSGEQMRFDYLVHAGAVTLVPVDQQQRIWFVRQYRHAVRTELLELPAGTLEPGEPPEETARRECREEIGMSAGNLRMIGELFLAPGYSSEHMQVYLASELRPDPLPRDQDEFLEIVQLGLEEVMQQLHSGVIRDAKTVAAIALALPLLRDDRR
jgi:ADP-ribose pyrophosphatase